MLCEYFHKLGHKSILLRHLNQDPLENFFGAIRAHGCSNIMPTAVAFEGAYKSLIINNLSSTHSMGANCEKDGGVCLQNLQYFFEMEGPAEPEISGPPIDDNHLNISVDVNIILRSDLPLNLEKCAAIAYCSGWLLRGAKKIIYNNCVTCTSQLESKDEEIFHKIIKNSEYSEKNVLHYPTKDVFEMFLHIETIVNIIMKSISYENNIVSYIKLIVATIVNFSFITCSEHKNELTEYIIKKNVSFCILNWCKEVNKILAGKRNYDGNDAIKLAAQTHYIKNKTRKRTRATGVSLSV